MSIFSRADLAQHTCQPLPEGSAALQPSEVNRLLSYLPGWRVEGIGIVRDYSFGDYATCVRWFGVVAHLAEVNNHHPDILVRWGKVTVTFWTHTVQGLSLNDFILAAKLEESYDQF